MPRFLETPRLILRPLTTADADGPYPGWLNDAETSAGNSHHVYPYTREQALEYIASVRGSRSTLALAVTLKEDGRHVGNISLQQIHAVNRDAELAVLIGDPACRGKGIGAEACEALVRHGFAALNLHRVHFGTFENNTGMRGIAMKLGFTQEGVLRQAVFKNGRHVDVILYGLLAATFNAR
ncbi:MAG: GNAT family N-acetyltransferase [Verrucomicrobiaceae bacterium]|nr:GNAT family N-acetyltransferase [Verrucomicrobiaceae bacterium]